MLDLKVCFLFLHNVVEFTISLEFTNKIRLEMSDVLKPGSATFLMMSASKIPSEVSVQYDCISNEFNNALY